MKFPKVGELRIKCMIDYEGDYVANVQVYRGFWSGWTNQRSYYAMNRSPEDCISLARAYVAARTPRPLLGVIN